MFLFQSSKHLSYASHMLGIICVGVCDCDKELIIWGSTIEGRLYMRHHGQMKITILDQKQNFWGQMTGNLHF